jgi:hypothetical protein
MEQAVADAPDNIEDVVSMEGVSFASPTFPEDFVYDLKLGRALYENLSFEQLMLTLNGLLGKVDKVMITKK